MIPFSTMFGDVTDLPFEDVCVLLLKSGLSSCAEWRDLSFLPICVSLTFPFMDLPFFAPTVLCDGDTELFWPSFRFSPVSASPPFIDMSFALERVVTMFESKWSVRMMLGLLKKANTATV